MLLCSGRLLTRFGVALMIRCYAGYGVHPGGPFNPFNASHYSGGSSGGSAVAVAMGICPVAIGFDGQSVVLHATNTQCHQHTVPPTHSATNTQCPDRATRTSLWPAGR